MANVVIPLKIRRHWDIDKDAIFRSTYKYDSNKRIHKFAYQPDTGELLFDIAPTFHDQLVRNYGRRRFDSYIRGIIFWSKKVVYLRGHEDETMLEKTKEMLRENGVGKHIRIIWGPEAAQELVEELKGL